MKKILLPIDNQTVDEKTLEYTKKIATAFDSVVIVVNVLPVIGRLSHPQIAPIIGLETESFRHVSEEMVEGVKNQLTEAGLNGVWTKVLEGDPASAIMDFANQEGVDVIIMHTHGMGAAKRFLVGSTTNRVVHYAKVPVLVVR